MHDFQIGNVVAHKDDFIILQPIFSDEIIVNLDFHSSTKIDVLHTQTLVALAYGLNLTTRKDSNAQTHLHSQLNGIAVLDIHCAQGCTVYA